MIADGGSNPDYLDEIRDEFKDLPIDIKDLPGRPVESRYKSLEFLNEDITIFLDSDQSAPEEWLNLIISPFSSGDEALVYTGGPTKPYRKPTNQIEIYLSLIEEHIYTLDLTNSLTYTPLGNTAWRTDILKQLGFDRRLKFEAEDNDLETRAYKAGYHGMFVKEAWVWHDKTIDKNLISTMRKRYRYLVGAATVFLKNGTIHQRSMERRKVVRHAFAVLELLLKPVALVHALVRWNLIIKHQ